VGTALAQRDPTLQGVWIACPENMSAAGTKPAAYDPAGSPATEPKRWMRSVYCSTEKLAIV